MSTVEPCLKGAAFDAAFPFYILVDREGTVRAVGPALQRALPKLKVGEALLAHLKPSRPKSLLQCTDWTSHDQQALVLHEADGNGLSLRGQICLQPPDLILLLLNPVVTRFEDLRKHGIQLSDLALHDATGDLLMLQRAAQTSLDDAQRLTDRLRQRSQQLQLMSELSALGTAYFSSDGVLKQSNGLFHRLLGWHEGPPQPCRIGDVEGRLQELASASEGKQLSLDRLSRNPGDVADMFTMQTRDGKHLSLSYRSGEASDHVLLIRDMTRETLVDRMKSEFLRTAAHELRTPMTSIFGFSEMLASMALRPDQVTSVAATIHKQAKWMVSLLNKLLDLSRIEARQLDDMQIGMCDCRDLLQSAIAVCGDPIEQARVVCHTPEHLPTIAADPVKAGQALGHVLDNAIRYSPEGGPVLIRCTQESVGSRVGVRIEVEDQGIGMSAEQLARVFERFYRADPSCNIPGSGLGMTLVEQIMLLHQGSIQLSSEEGRGTRATLWFPAA